ncbi:MAG: hypothetical protein LBQ24_01450 [Candidatus Peribacteria bacterium]|jgi:hypothetical protein|nr:hypothetical protein [Candidatus Peribacteria bacterium]
MQDVINFVKSFNKDPSHTEIKDPSYKEIKSLLLKIMFSIIDYRNNDVTTNQSLLNEIIQIFTIKR